MGSTLQINRDILGKNLTEAQFCVFGKGMFRGFDIMNPVAVDRRGQARFEHSRRTGRGRRAVLRFLRPGLLSLSVGACFIGRRRFRRFLFGSGCRFRFFRGLRIVLLFLRFGLCRLFR